MTTLPAELAAHLTEQPGTTRDDAAVLRAGAELIAADMPELAALLNDTAHELEQGHPDA